MESIVQKLRATRETFEREGQELLAAGKRFQSFLHEESRDWRGFLHGWLEQTGDEVRELLTPRGFERRLLLGVNGTLGELEDRVKTRLERLEEAKAIEAEADESPIRGYDKLTAKAIVARLDRLSPEKVKAVYEHEQKTKKRATVLRAAESRIAA